MADIRVAIPLAIAALILLPVSASSQGQGITHINCEGASSTFVIGINDAGRAVGFYTNGDGVQGFITDNRGNCEPLEGLPPGYMPFNLNDAEHIVGIVGDQGFVFRRGQVTPLLYPAPAGKTTLQTFTTGINNRGQVVGFYELDSQPVGVTCGPDCPFMWEDGVYTALAPDLAGADDSVGATGINPRSDIIGNWNDDSNGVERGYLWPRGATPASFAFPVGAGAVARMNAPTSINARGDVVGFFYELLDPDDPLLEGVLFGPCRGFFRDRDGTMTELKVPGAAYTCTLGLNAAGEISGVWTSNSGTNYGTFSWHGFIAKKEALVVAQP